MLYLLLDNTNVSLGACLFYKDENGLHVIHQVTQNISSHADNYSPLQLKGLNLSWALHLLANLHTYYIYYLHIYILIYSRGES
jgi:hypothetical protein